ncbi:MAG: glutamyl-tRNA reductase [Thermonemataceae bacterium]
MHYQFRAISLSYKNAPLEVREKVALDENTCKKILANIKDYVEVEEMLILSTCNRTEIYYTASKDHHNTLIKLIGIQKEATEIQNYTSHFQKMEGLVAIRHLFRVAIGLESQVVGDMQIPNQVKKAYQWTADEGLAGHFLHRLMHTIFFTNKRVVQETPFRDGAASTSYAAVELIEQLTNDLVAPKVLVLGVGEIGQDVCRNLVSKDFKNVDIINRTFEKAQTLADECGFQANSFDQVWQHIKEADVVISSIARNDPFIVKEQIASINQYSYKYFIDLSVPRSVAQDVESVPGMLVYDVDQLQMRADEALKQRLAAIPLVEQIIEEAIRDFKNWTKEMEISPTIHKLKDALEQIRHEEMARYLKSMSEEEQALVDKVTRGMMQKIIKLPVLQLKAACKRGEADTLIDVLNDLFNLEKQNESSKTK